MDGREVETIVCEVEEMMLKVYMSGDMVQPGRDWI